VPVWETAFEVDLKLRRPVGHVPGAMLSGTLCHSDIHRAAWLPRRLKCTVTSWVPLLLVRCRRSDAHCDLLPENWSRRIASSVGSDARGADPAMRRRRFTEEQVIGILKKAEGGAKGLDLCRRHGISEQTFYRWKAKYGGLEVNEAPSSPARAREYPFASDWSRTSRSTIRI
jgi:putative transposase